jgi:hypothetical protein
MRQGKAVLLAGMLATGSYATAHVKGNPMVTNTDTITNFPTYKHAITFAGLLQTRCLRSFNKNVDMNGRNFR